MKVIARPAGTGKTKELLELADSEFGQILTTNKRGLKAKADAYGYDDVLIIDWNDMMYGNYSERRPLFIHKAEDVIQELLNSDFAGVKLKGLSLRMDEE